MSIGIVVDGRRGTHTISARHRSLCNSPLRDKGVDISAVVVTWSDRSRDRQGWRGLARWASAHPSLESRRDPKAERIRRRVMLIFALRDVRELLSLRGWTN